jgi:hypothetical protein
MLQEAAKASSIAITWLQRPIWLAGRPFDAPKSRIVSWSNHVAAHLLGIEGKGLSDILNIAPAFQGLLDRELL